MRITRRALIIENQQLKARMGAAAGETRKNLRDRLARTTQELAEAKTKIKSLENALEKSQMPNLADTQKKAEQKQEPEAPKVANG